MSAGPTPVTPKAGGGEGRPGFNEAASRELFKASSRGTSGQWNDASQFESVGAQIAEFRRLLDLGADPCFDGCEHRSMCAFTHPFSLSLAKIAFFLDSGKVNVNWAAGSNQTTALHEVCRGNRSDFKVAAVVRLLLAAGANPLAKNSDGYTALHCIAENCGSLEAEFAAVALIEAGCDPNARCGNDKTAIDIADQTRTDDAEEVTFKTNMLSALKDDPKGSSKAKYEAWCVAEAQRPGATDYRGRLVAFYEKYDPAKVGSVDTMLKAYDRREEEMFEALVSRHGAEPSGASPEGEKKQNKAEGGDETDPDTHNDDADNGEKEITGIVPE